MGIGFYLSVALVLPIKHLHSLRSSSPSRCRLLLFCHQPPICWKWQLEMSFYNECAASLDSTPCSSTAPWWPKTALFAFRSACRSVRKAVYRLLPPDTAGFSLAFCKDTLRTFVWSWWAVRLWSAYFPSATFSLIVMWLLKMIKMTRNS